MQGLQVFVGMGVVVVMVEVVVIVCEVFVVIIIDYVQGQVVFVELIQGSQLVCCQWCCNYFWVIGQENVKVLGGSGDEGIDYCVFGGIVEIFYQYLVEVGVFMGLGEMLDEIGVYSFF